MQSNQHKLAYILCALWALCACMPQSIRDQQAFNQQLLAHPDLQHLSLPLANGSLHAVLMPPLQKGIDANRDTGADIDSAVVFIHGTPGDWTNAGYYLLDPTLRAKAWVVSVDRLGWGESAITDSPDTNLAAVDFSVQAKAIEALLSHLQHEKKLSRIVLAGHSLGASIAPQVAMDFPASVDGMLLLAGSLDPKLGGPRWYNRLAAWPGVHYLLPDGLDRSNREIMALRDNLSLMRDRWNTVSIPVTVIQGMEDSLVYPANIDFIEQMLSSPPLRSIRLPDAGHLINLEQKKAVIDELSRLFEIVSNE